MPNDVRYLLDNDTFSNALRGNDPIRQKIERFESQVWLSIITVRQSLRGALDTFDKAINPNYRSSDKKSVEIASEFLVKKLEALSEYPIQPVDANAYTLYRSWPNKVHRIGTEDCLIAATAICHDFIVVTCDTDDFQRIADETGIAALRWEDWSL
jgi:predicted nucleic acid-binding protein